MRRKLGRGCWEEAGSRKLGGIMEEASWMRDHGGGIVEEGLAGQGRSQARGSLGPENVRFCLCFDGKCELREGETRTGATQRSRSIEFYHALGGTGNGTGGRKVVNTRRR